MKHGLLTLIAVAACEPTPIANPTWVDVEPIVRGTCTHCHGANDRAGGGVRFDFFAMNAEICGDASAALDARPMAHGLATLIEAAITPTAAGTVRMPPSPASPLNDWERETLLAWTRAPMLGSPSSNHLPRVTVAGEVPRVADRAVEFTLLVDDPDGEPVVGVVQLGERTVKLDGPGAFQVTIDTASFDTGRYVARSSVCDGWELASYDLSEIVVIH
jgi:hypothetical protein